MMLTNSNVFHFSNLMNVINLWGPSKRTTIYRASSIQHLENGVKLTIIR